MNKESTFNPKLEKDIDIKFGNFKQILFLNQDKNKMILSSDYYYCLVDLVTGSVKTKKKDDPSVFFGEITKEVLANVYVNWKEASKTLGPAVYSKKFVS